MIENEQPKMIEYYRSWYMRGNPSATEAQFMADFPEFKRRMLSTTAMAREERWKLILEPREHWAIDQSAMPNDTEVRRLIAEFFSLNVQIRLEDGRIRWTAPQGAMTVGLLRRVKALEPGLIAMLSGPAWAPTAQEGA